MSKELKRVEIRPSINLCRMVIANQMERRKFLWNRSYWDCLVPMMNIYGLFLTNKTKTMFSNAIPKIFTFKTLSVVGNEILTVVIIEVTFGFYRDSIFILQIIGRLHLMVSVAGTVCPITTIDIPKRMAI